jgi:hypothetical protein
MTIACAALAALAMSGQAENATKPPTPPETLIRLTVQPMAAPKPALRYLLLPELREMNPGNPIQNYLKCFSEQQNFFFNKESCERRDKLLVMPLKELPAQDLQDYGRYALRQADWAARLDKADWQILLKLKTDGIGLLLPDVQGMRVLANALKVRFRAEVALHHYEDAIRTAKTMFALSRHMGEHPTLIGDLVGMAIAFVAIGPLEEMLEQPGCPNLYWALTNLPAPFISLDLGLQAERTWFPGQFPEYDDKAPMSAEQIQKLVAEIDKLRKFGEEKLMPARAWLDARTKDDRQVNAARQRLLAAGIPEDRLSRFPTDQVILLDEKREYEERRDDTMKLMNLPEWQFEPLFSQTEPKVKEKSESTLIAKLLIPSVQKVRRAQARLEQRLALLRHVEALRLYAAEHDGRLPETLSEVTVPLPLDPITGQPFHYRVEGATAHLRGSPPPGLEKDPNFNVHYEVTIQR